MSELSGVVSCRVNVHPNVVTDFDGWRSPHPQTLEMLVYETGAELVTGLEFGSGIWDMDAVACEIKNA